MDSTIKIMIQSAKAGGAVVKNYFGQNLKITEKSTAADFCTKADRDSERAILSVLEKYFPRYNIYSEEKGRVEKGSKCTFIIDPLDGSNNFVLGIPYFSVSIALCEGKNIIEGVVYNIMRDQTYWARKGEGAFLDGVKICVNKENDIKRASITYSCGYISDANYAIRIEQGLQAQRIKRWLCMWSVALDLCLLASSKIEGFISYNTEAYDYAAGKLIAKEAGAKVTDFEGKEEKDDINNIFLATNGTPIHEEIMKFL